MIPVISVVGRNSNVGKTTLVCNLLKELKSKGYRVATIKHDSKGFDIDHPGKDTWKHNQAGADIVIISSPKKFAYMENTTDEYTLDEITKNIGNVDIIITEGYKYEDKPKIEVFRKGITAEPMELGSNTFAIVTDTRLDYEISQFGFNEIEDLAVLIVKEFINKND